MPKKTLTLLLILMLALMVPAFASAETGDFIVTTTGTYGTDYEYDPDRNILVILTDTPVTVSGGTEAAPISGGIEVYSEQNEVNLTLNGLHVHSGSDIEQTLYANASAHITLASGSENTLTADVDCALFGESDLTISGSGKLTTKGVGVGIVTVGGDLTIEDGIIVTEAQVFGIEVSMGTATISGGDITATGNEIGILVGNGAEGHLVIEGGTVSASGANDKAINCESGNIKISGGTVTADGFWGGIVADVGNIDITTTGKVTATSTNEEYSVGIESGEGNITIANATVIATGTNAGIGTMGKVTVNSGTVTATGSNNAGINGAKGVSIKGGIVKANGNSAISAGFTDEESGQVFVGNIEISDGEVYANGNGDFAVHTPTGGITVTGGYLYTNGAKFGILTSETSGLLKVDGGRIEANGSEFGIIASNSATINGGTITAKGSDQAFIVRGTDFTVNGGTITADEGNVGISVEGCSVSLNGGKITAKGGDHGFFIYGDDLTVNGTLIANSTNYAALFVQNGNMYLDGGEIIATSEDEVGFQISTFSEDPDAQLPKSNATVNSGTLKATGGKVGIVVDGGSVLTVKGGTVTAMGTSEDGIAAYDGKVDLIGGKVSASGNNFGILVPSENNFSISGDNVTMQGKGQAVSNRPTLEGTDLTFIASENFDGSSPVSYDEDSFGNYRYLRLSKSCIVTFDMQGYGSAPADLTVAWGDKLTQPTAPTAADKLFGGWYKDAACTSKWSFATDMVEGNTTLFAKWTSDYAIISGENQVVEPGTPATFRSNAPYDKFEAVLVDGREIAASNYTSREGSTIVTLKPEYLNTLSVGKHTLTIVSTDGEASTEFTIKERPVQTLPPKTGDNSQPMLYMALLMLSIAGMMALKKRVHS